MKYKLTKKCLKKNLKISKGYRLIEDWELLKLSREDNKIKQLLIDDHCVFSWSVGRKVRLEIR